jgi:hypothetical protein
MVDKITTLKHIEESIRDNQLTRLQGLCNELKKIPSQEFAAYAYAMSFIGCDDIDFSSVDKATTKQDDRILAARIMLLKLGLSTMLPHWSSSIIDNLWKCVLSTNGGRFSDLFIALFSLFNEFRHELTNLTANFVEDITYKGKIQLWSQYRDLYAVDDFEWLLAKTKKEMLLVEYYLTLFILPYKLLSAELAVKIMGELIHANISFDKWRLTVGYLYDVLDTEDGKNRLSVLMGEDIPLPYRSSLSHLLDTDNNA